MRDLFTRVTLAVIACLLAANLFVMLQRPAQAQNLQRICVGVSTVWTDKEIRVFRAWSDGTVEQYTPRSITWNGMTSLWDMK